MKKNLLVTLGICSAFVLTACPSPDKGDDKKDDWTPNVADVRIATLLGENHKVPHTPVATDWKASIIQDEMFGCMEVYAYCTDVVDANGKHLDEVYAATLTADTNWHSYNNATNTVAEAGYMFGDTANEEDANVMLNFWAEDNEMTLYVCDFAGVYKGKPIDEDGNEVEWYQEYVDEGFTYETTNKLDAATVNAALGTNATSIVDIPVPAVGYVHGILYGDEEEGTEDSYCVYYPDDSLEAIAEKAADDGFIVRVSEEIIGYNWEAILSGDYDNMYLYADIYEFIGEDHELVTQAAVIEGTVSFVFMPFYYTENLTTDTAWNASAEEIFAATGIALPFVAMGEDYEGTAEYFEQYGCYCIFDTYYDDVTEQICDALVEDGYVYNEEYNCYEKDIAGYDYVQVQAYFDGGNNIDIYPRVKPHVTEDTDWNQDVADKLIELGIELPFVALGNEYEIVDYTEDYGCWSIEDGYTEDLLANYGDVLVAAGFEFVGEEDGASEYYIDLADGSGLYVDIYYYEGNVIDLYIEEPTPEYTVAEVLALEELSVANAEVGPMYVSGKVVSIGKFNSSKGYYENVVIEDATGKQITIRTINLNGTKVGLDDFSAVGIKVGDEIVAYGYAQSDKNGKITMGTSSTNMYVYLAETDAVTAK